MPIIVALAIALAGLSLNGTPARAANTLLTDYLRTCGISDADFARFSDDRQMADEEIDVVRRLAIRLRDCPADALRRMMAQESESAPTEEKFLRGQTLRLRGHVESVEQVDDLLWRCTLASDTIPHRAIVYVGQNGNLPHAEVVVDAVFVKRVPGVQDRQVPVVVAGRLQRKADGPLGSFDFGAGLFDGVHDNCPLVAEDSAAFYRLLEVTKLVDASKLQREATTLDSAAAASLYHDPAAVRGRLFRVTGTARRAVRAPIDDSAMAARLGADHYFQIDLLTDALEDNPLTFCTLELPRGMPLGGPPGYGQPIEVTGFFLKTWQYPVPLTAGEKAANPAAARAFQAAPLLIGPKPNWHPSSAAKESSSGWGFTGILALAITGLGLLLWSLRQSDLEFSRYLQ
jgi:hypothetical protein